jgi:hypothetical protein
MSAEATAVFAAGLDLGSRSTFEAAVAAFVLMTSPAPFLALFNHHLPNLSTLVRRLVDVRGQFQARD